MKYLIPGSLFAVVLSFVMLCVVVAMSSYRKVEILEDLNTKVREIKAVCCTCDDCQE